MFEIAARKKYRFPFRGQISVEDLWDLSMDNLNEIYKVLKKAANVGSEESLDEGQKVDQDLLNKIEIVKHIYNTKKAEAEEAKAAVEKAKKKKVLAEILAKKENAALEAMSPEEIRKMLEDLE